MSSRCREKLVRFVVKWSRAFRDCFVALLAMTLYGAAPAAERQLRVCADPDNLPYSHRNGTGFENRIAELVARDLDAVLTYTWLPQRRGFVRKTLNAGTCDVIIGVPTDLELVRTTQPYYRSAYAFVFRRDAAAPFRTFDDTRLKTARIGVQLIGNDLAASPPGYALAERGLTENVVGYAPYGERPQAQLLVDAVANRELDVALVWGPQAAYYARLERVPLELSNAHAPRERGALPFEFDMSMGVRKSDAALQAELDRVIATRRGDITQVLREYGVPLVETVDARQVRAGTQ